ncbi:CrcB family protein [Haloarculaceae archaeon H-GB2-1]|nr:CrcB family protein [Haloarculaceae archaeon H-GB1-1]MEA5407156.1 CrcB family protein [Haloarculaceae archaeon H-GB2-1]
MGRVNPAVLVGAGGVLGALSRHLVGERVEGEAVDTLTVNVAGSFLLGLLVATPVDGGLALVFGTGFCGAFTTFSSFAFETVRQFETGRRKQALVNATVNLAGALLAVGLGGAVSGFL